MSRLNILKEAYFYLVKIAVYYSVERAGKTPSAEGWGHCVRALGRGGREIDRYDMMLLFTIMTQETGIKPYVYMHFYGLPS